VWVKTGDEFVDDAADLSDAAVRTLMDAWHWNARRMLDLHIPKRDLPRFAFSANAAQAIDELVTGGWWRDDETSWYLAYRPEWQLSREQIERRRHQNVQAQERARRHRRGDHSLCLPGKCAESAVDTGDDSADESDADPARFGSVREKSTKQQKITTTNLDEIAKATGCYECGRRSVLNPNQPPCDDHKEFAA
jgi:hypothetical protein